MSPELRTQLLGLIHQDERSQNRIATAAGIDPGQLSKCLRGEKSMSIESLESLVIALGAHLVITTGKATAVSAQAEGLTKDRLQALERFGRVLATIPLEADPGLAEDLEYSIRSLERVVEKAVQRVAV